jgi:hypothetical protein
VTNAVAVLSALRPELRRLARNAKARGVGVVRIDELYVLRAEARKLQRKQDAAVRGDASEVDLLGVEAAIQANAAALQVRDAAQARARLHQQLTAVLRPGESDELGLGEVGAGLDGGDGAAVAKEVVPAVGVVRDPAGVVLERAQVNGLRPRALKLLVEPAELDRDVGGGQYRANRVQRLYQGGSVLVSSVFSGVGHWALLWNSEQSKLGESRVIQK